MKVVHTDILPHSVLHLSIMMYYIGLGFIHIASYFTGLTYLIGLNSLVVMHVTMIFGAIHKWAII